MRTAWFLPNHGNDSLPAFLGPLTSVIESRARTRPKLCLRKAGLCYRVPNKDSLQALPPHRFTFNKEHASDSLQALSSTLFSLVIASRKKTRSKVCLWTAGPFLGSPNGLALSLVVGPLCFVIESRKQLSQSFLRPDWFSSLNSRKGLAPSFDFGPLLSLLASRKRLALSFVFRPLDSLLESRNRFAPRFVFGPLGSF
jgi:hypothetical protein